MVFSLLLQGYLTQPFKLTHRAIDIGWGAIGVRDPQVLCWADGVVVASYYDRVSGNIVVVKHEVPGSESYYLSQYKHLKSREVDVGQKVAGNQPIGIGGTTGSASTGVHLHYEIWVCPKSYVWTTANVDKAKYAVDPRSLFYTSSLKGQGFQTMSVTASNMPYATTTYSDLKYRDLPSLKAVVLGYLPANTKIAYLGKTNVIDGYVWAKLLFNDRVVYSAVKYLVVSEQPETVTEIVEVEKPVDVMLSDGKYTVTVKS